MTAIEPTDPTGSPTPESLRLDAIRGRHVPDENQGESCDVCPGSWPCDVAFVLAAYDDRKRAFDALMGTAVKLWIKAES